ncbi:MAG TPA: LLM class flavin-dependent oxidoreductase [Stellaceae bacterium]|jgi:alkanesulfonate monooxygenase SsuD/methylene tetrahydromethanopterin reductase-like flavin-dependent oxidoreductase (luciferase family)|nr:LLM class flavin-dependent oxidoreductase [Stellaceae bacterium]
MAEIDFALWDAVGGYSSSDEVMADVYDEHIALAREIEAAGWHSYFVIEHQNSPIGRITAPSVYLTAVARATSKLRIGAMMWQLPFYHPIRLAQEVAMLDHLSRGRVEFGTGIGVHEHEFMRWGMDFYQRAAISGEVMQIVKMAWTQDEVTFKGKYFQLDEALPQPKPFQKPHPPIWAAVHSDAAIEFAAKNNLHVSQNLDTDEVVARKFDLYRKIWRDCRHAGPMPRIFLQRQFHVAETDEKAHEEARQFLAAREGGAVPVGGGPLEKTRIGWGTHARGMGRDSERPDDKARGETIAKSAKSYEFSLESGLAIVGSPETVIRTLKDSKKRIGYDIMCANHEIGRMPNAMVRNSIRLMGEKVVPAFK